VCLIALAWRAHPRYRLIVAANRDEYFARPSSPAEFWEEPPHILAGRDLEAGGTWLGITVRGRFAALTNYRNPADRRPLAPSRGALVSDFLAGTSRPLQYLKSVNGRAADYNGFSLLVGDADSLYFFSNRGGPAMRVEPGVHALSNNLLDTPWPKITKSKAWLAAHLDAPLEVTDAFRLLDDGERAPNGGYGTRCSTVLAFANDGKVEFHERSFREDGSVSGTVSYRFSLDRRKSSASSRRAGFPPRKTPLPAR
jgi:uncharacterized protein with NRDE domain